MSLRLLDEDEELDPILSVVNLVDVFLVMIGALMMIIAANPLNPFAAEKAVVVKNPGQPEMEMVVKDGQKIETYKASSEIGSGEGSRAGVAYRLKDGSFIYVPEAAASPEQKGGQTPAAPAPAAPARRP
jgi:hypothetical protein